MPPVLSPAEALGLSGATLEGRIRRAAHHVADATFARVADRLRADAWANQMIYEHDGAQEAIRIMLRPLLVMPEQLAYVHHVCLQLIEALKRLPGLYLEGERIRFTAGGSQYTGVVRNRTIEGTVNTGNGIRPWRANQ